MTRASSSSFFWPDFGQTGKKPLQGLGISKINFSDIVLTKITSHRIKGN
jgi:hypothetical protein